MAADGTFLPGGKHPRLPCNLDLHFGFRACIVAAIALSLSFAVLVRLRYFREWLLKHYTLLSAGYCITMFCLQLSISTFSEVRRMNVQLCPTLYISLTYDGGIIPTRQCTNTNATESLNCVATFFDSHGVTCESYLMSGLGFFALYCFAFLPLLTNTSTRSTILICLSYIIVVPIHGIVAGFTRPPLWLFTIFMFITGTSVAWTRSRQYDHEKRHFMVWNLMKVQHARNQELLTTLIPRSVQAHLENLANMNSSQDGGTQTWSLPHVTILCLKFSPPISELCKDGSSAQRSLDRINDLIFALDRLVDRYGMYKYQQINDTYIVSCPMGALPRGLPDDQPYPFDYTIQMALLALRAQEIISESSSRFDVDVSVQAGLNCGPAAGAVIGEFRKFYCIYGDVVNTAARLSDAAKAREILCSATFRDNISRRAPSLINLYPGPPVFLKGKGKQEIYVLKRSQIAAEGPGMIASKRNGIRPVLGARDINGIPIWIEEIDVFYKSDVSTHLSGNIQLPSEELSIWAAHKRSGFETNDIPRGMETSREYLAQWMRGYGRL